MPTGNSRQLFRQTASQDDILGVLEVLDVLTKKTFSRYCRVFNSAKKKANNR